MRTVCSVNVHAAKGLDETQEHGKEAGFRENKLRQELRTEGSIEENTQLGVQNLKSPEKRNISA